MSVFTAIDRALRRSVLARAQPFIRARTPWLHRALLVARDAVLPFRSDHGLTRYQYSALERFYAVSPDLSGAVLEIGSDLECVVLRELASRSVGPIIGLNLDVDFSATARDKARASPPFEIVQGDVRRLPFKDESVSSILSIMAFEHIHDLGAALQEQHRVLKPNGIVYSEFGPIWSCSIGHHVYAIADGLEARHWKPGLNPVPHFAHLLMSAQELESAVLQARWVSPALAKAIVQWIFEEDGVNRFFYEDYVKSFEASPFQIRHFASVREHVSRRTQKRLELAWPGHRDFSVRMVEVVLQKANRNTDQKRL